MKKIGIDWPGEGKMANPGPHDERELAEQREAARRKDEAEEAHRQRLYQLELDKHNLEKQKADLEKDKATKTHRAALWAVFGTIIAAVITAIGAAVAASIALGNKVDPGASNIFSTIYQGARTSYKIFHPGTPLAEALPKSTQTPAPLPVTVAVPQVSTPVSSPEPTAPVVLAGPPCTGLSLQRWDLSAAQVRQMIQDNKFAGYKALVTMKNISNEVILVARTGGNLTDDSGQSLGLADSSLGPDNFTHSRSTVVDPGVALPANFQFNGRGNAGKTVSFTINLAISADGGKTYSAGTFGCNPVSVPAVQTP